jgi:hypothetical protein
MSKEKTYYVTHWYCDGRQNTRAINKTITGLSTCNLIERY